MRHRIYFFAQQPPTEENLQKSRKILIAEGAVAAVIMSLATGNFMAGYLTSLGASVSFCALMGTLPQLGCVLQMAAPFLFEKLHYRKGVIWGLCVFFRLSLGLMMLTPIFFHEQTMQLGFTFMVYFFAFAAAGLVTPGLQQMTVDISPKEHRGAFFARKDIVSACVNSAAVLVMGRQLDYFSALGQTQRGYLVVGLVSLLLAAADAAILGAVHEQPAPFATKVHLRDLAAPLRDVAYRPILLFLVCGGLAGGISASFLPVHLLRGLQLSHTFITSTGVFSALVGMLGTWVWGQLADRTTWNVIVRRTALISGTCTLGWFFITPAIAPFAAPLLLAATAGCGGAGAMASLNLQYAGSPPAGKTTYLGVTSALSSIAGCCAVVAGTALQPMLQMLFGARSVPILFLLSAVLLYLNLFLHAGKLPQVR